MKARLSKTQNVVFSEIDNYNDLMKINNLVRTFFWHRNDEISRELELNITNARARENKR